MEDQSPDPDVACSIDELRVKFQIIPGFAKLAISCGCPIVDEEKLIPSVLFHWITDNYSKVRATAGLSVLPETESSDPAEIARYKARNTLLTFADYAESRSSDQEMKEAWRDTRATIAEH